MLSPHRGRCDAQRHADCLTGFRISTKSQGILILASREEPYQNPFIFPRRGWCMNPIWPMLVLVLLLYMAMGAAVAMGAAGIVQSHGLSQVVRAHLLAPDDFAAAGFSGFSLGRVQSDHPLPEPGHPIRYVVSLHISRVLDDHDLVDAWQEFKADGVQGAYYTIDIMEGGRAYADAYFSPDYLRKYCCPPSGDPPLVTPIASTPLSGLGERAIVHVGQNGYREGISQELFLQQGNMLLSIRWETDTTDTAQIEALAAQAAKKFR
jgi:hypothetical protein